MAASSVERRIRALLPFTRLLQSCMPLSVSRWLLEQTKAHVRLDSDITHEFISADGVACEWFIPTNSPADRALLYLHGGGFVFGMTPPHRQMLAYLARKMGIRTLAVDYRLAPDHPFPAPLDDCLTVYRWLLRQGVSAENIVVAGDSAGGNLTVTIMMKLRDSGDPLPAAVACLSPVGDFSGRASRSGFRDPLLPPRAMRFYNKSYVGRSDPRDPMISPVFGDWRGLPPMLIHAGED